MSATTIPAVFLATVERHLARVALRSKQLGLWCDVTWEEYRERVAGIASGLRALGLRKGDRVSIIGDNCPEWVAIDLGIQCAAGVTVGIYTTSAWQQCGYVAGHSESAFLFVENEEQLDKWLRFRDQAACAGAPYPRRVRGTDAPGHDQCQAGRGGGQGIFWLEPAFPVHGSE